MLLDGYLVPRQSQQQKQPSSSFSKYFEVKQRNNIFESFVAITSKIKIFVAPDFSNSYNTAICKLRLDLSPIRLLHKFDIRNTQNLLKS